MTEPCINGDHFLLENGTDLTPQDYMQIRRVATATTSSVVTTYIPNDGIAKNDPLIEVDVTWTNTSPVAQAAYAVMTRGGSSVALTARSRAYIQTEGGTAVGSPPGVPVMPVVSRFGNGSDKGMVASDFEFMIVETRIPDRSILVGDTLTVPPGQSFRARVELVFVSDFWENADVWLGSILGDELEARVVSGDLMVDVFAYPSL